MLRTTKSTIFMMVAALIIWGCKKKGDTIVEVDEDKSNLGVYSGVLVGSSGYYQIKISQSGSVAMVNFDGVQYKLESQFDFRAEQDLREILFSDGTVALRFSVDSDGSNPLVTFAIPGHEVEATTFKELSNSPVYNYTGQSGSTYGQASTSSIYNLSIQGSQYYALEKNENGEVFRQTGSVKQVGNKIEFKSSDGELNVLANYDPASGSITFSDNGPGNYSFWFEFNLGEYLLETGEERSPTPPPFRSSLKSGI